MTKAREAVGDRESPCMEQNAEWMEDKSQDVNKWSVNIQKIKLAFNFFSMTKKTVYSWPPFKMKDYE